MARRLVKGTPLERPARALVHAMHRIAPAAAQVRADRDRQLIRRILTERLTSSSTCIDVGAHSGEVLAEFVRLAPSGVHYAVEPLPHLAEELRRRFPSVRVLECALTDHDGEATFFHPVKRPAWSGLRRQPYPKKTDVREIQVEARRLDGLLPADLPVDVIKIDVEGAELEALRGAREVLRRWKPHVIFEHARLHAAEYGVQPRDLHNLLSEVGLRIFSLRGPQLSLSEFEATCAAAAASGYGRHAETNFLAAP